VSDTGQGAVGLVARLPFSTPEEFLARYGANITRGGIYLRSKTIKPPGTQVTLELKLSDGRRIIHATATVHYVTGQSGEGISGMGLRFVEVDADTRRLLDSAVVALPHAHSAEPPIPHGVGPVDYGPEGSGIPSAAPALAVIPGLRRAAPRPAAAAEKPKVVLAPHAPHPNVAPAGPTPTAPPFEPYLGEPPREGPIIGIDLGTTNSCAGFVKGGRPLVLGSRQGYNTVPSIVALNARGKLVVGHPARGQMLTNPRLTVYGSKRLIGRAFESEAVQAVKERFQYEVTAGPSGEAAVLLGDRVYGLQQISAMILREVRDVAQQQLGVPVTRAVITVPAHFNDNQRQAVREAAKLAGLHAERIVNEPTAAALAFGWGRELKQRVLVYDLGGGTFDASLLQLEGSVYEVLSTGGDTFLGGIDFDHAIVGWLLQRFEQKQGRSFLGDRVAMQRLMDAAERAKCALSERQQTRVHVPFVTLVDDQPLDVDEQLTREQLVELTAPLVERTIAVCAQVLAARGFAPADVDEVILVGGQSRAPLVHEQITRFFGRAPARSVHPDEAVALGAALLADSLGQLDGVTLIDVLPMAIGVGLPGGRFKPVLERNTALPTRRTHRITNSRDDQQSLELSIFQGDAERCLSNEYLGTLKLDGLPKGPRGTVVISVCFELSNEALLKVSAKEESSGRAVSSTFSTLDTPAILRERLAQDSPQEPLAGPLPSSVPSAEAIAATSEGSVLGWLRRLFGR
jgi:molecular chaperone DnaK